MIVPVGLKQSILKSAVSMLMDIVGRIIFALSAIIKNLTRTSFLHAEMAGAADIWQMVFANSFMLEPEYSNHSLNSNTRIGSHLSSKIIMIKRQEVGVGIWRVATESPVDSVIMNRIFPKCQKPTNLQSSATWKIGWIFNFKKEESNQKGGKEKK